MHDKIVIIPTYNERENVLKMIAQVCALPEFFDILIVDDASPDGTADLVKSIMPQYPDRVHMIQREGKLGLGTAYIAGFKWSLAHGYEYIFEMDCDFSHPVVALPMLYRACSQEGYDVAVGSRYIKGGGIQDWPQGRILMSKGASYYVRFITWLPVHDTTAGFVCYRKKVLETIDLDAIHFKGYAFQIEMKYIAHCLGFKIKEVPILFVNRKQGTSKMNSSIFGEAFFGVIKLRWWHLFKRFPQKRNLHLKH